MAIRINSLDELARFLRQLLTTTAKPIRVFPVGTQGSGKSTLGNRLAQALDGVEIVSPDQIRMDLYLQSHPGETADYRKLRGFLSAGREGAVRDAAMQRFLESDAPVVYLDQMNLTSRARLPYLRPESVNVAIVLEAELETVLERHRRRPDKAEDIPERAVVAGYRRLETPTDEEFDVVLLSEPEPEQDLEPEQALEAGPHRGQPRRSDGTE